MLVVSSQVFPPPPGLSARCRVDSIWPRLLLSTRRLRLQSRRYLGVFARTGSSWCCWLPDVTLSGSLARGREFFPSYFTFRSRMFVCEANRKRKMICFLHHTQWEKCLQASEQFTWKILVLMWLHYHYYYCFYSYYYAATTHIVRTFCLTNWGQSHNLPTPKQRCAVSTKHTCHCVHMCVCAHVHTEVIKSEAHLDILGPAQYQRQNCVCHSFMETILMY